jgi:hypothetical protein
MTALSLFFFPLNVAHQCLVLNAHKAFNEFHLLNARFTFWFFVGGCEGNPCLLFVLMRLCKLNELKGWIQQSGQSVGHS